MDGDMQRRLVSGGASRRGGLISEAGWQWMVGITNMLLILALFALAVVKAPSSAKSNNMRCLQQVANEEHASLEAFFQNPAQQDALVQAMRICSR
ncbi:hypothetical protein SAMN05216466_105241 [Paraburkholderia phenazinium]|jgi:hypothetical protein|uniref:Uncharacterized protein n=1 Tax=Paraburkholderia phenazinium TaxID=60549 RepID=A0A1G7X8J1_9BURK|nr:hypothetical protein SAMN05216466_105241 [Paraburkholderia phenazinium]